MELANEINLEVYLMNRWVLWVLHWWNLAMDAYSIVHSSCGDHPSQRPQSRGGFASLKIVCIGPIDATKLRLSEAPPL